MPWLIIVLGYLLGSIPTAYIASHINCSAIGSMLVGENTGHAHFI